MTPPPYAFALAGLIGGVTEGFFDCAAWQRWALSQLQLAPHGTPWLVDLLEAEDPREACGALWDGWRAEECEPLHDHVSMRLGFHYLLFSQGMCSLVEALNRSGLLADGANYNEPSCEVFYDLLNDVEQSAAIGSAAATLEVRARELYAKHAAFAARAEAEILGHLPDDPPR